MTATNKSLSEVHETVAIPGKSSTLRRLFAFVGPAYLVSVGYMDPGNWATDIEGGSRFGYQLIWVLLMSNLMAILLQTLCARLGIVAGTDLARACRESYPRPVAYALWVVTEIAIIATDLAEVLGTAIGLNLLFGLPLLWGVMLTAADVLLLLYFQHLGIRKVEAFIITLVATIGACFVIEMFLAKPDLGGIIGGFVPRLNHESLYVAIGILGATVMPHNLYLHSALVQTRKFGDNKASLRQACKYNLIDSAVALNAALFVNAAILILAASAFFRNGVEVSEIQQAHELLTPLLGATLASTAFAIALLCSGQSSTLTGTIAGQVVMEGFINLRVRPWLRRIITRSLAIIPAALAISIMGDTSTYKLLILSQVILSLQLPFAIIPLIQFTSDRRKMGEFANKLWVKILAWVTAVIIIALNVRLVTNILSEWITSSAAGTQWYHLLVIVAVIALGLLLLYLLTQSFVKRRRFNEEIWPVYSVSVTSPPACKRIAVALEAAPTDELLIRQALDTAIHHNADLLLVHVADGVMPRYWRGQAEDFEIRGDEQYLERIAAGVRALGHEAQAIMGYGNPPDEIVRIVNEEQADLLIMGTHGHRFFKDIIFGATANRVRHKIKCPVFMVRLDIDAPKP